MMGIGVLVGLVVVAVVWLITDIFSTLKETHHG